MHDKFTLIGKTVLVTGGGSGIGAGVALEMARAGANVMITGRSASKLEETVSSAQKDGLVLAYTTGDITNRNDIERVIDTTVETFGGLHCLVNNAGGASQEQAAPLLSMSEALWDEVVGLNLKAPFMFAQAAAKRMKDGGSIINVSSWLTRIPCPMMAHYTAAKAGIDSLTSTMAIEWGHLGIRVNSVSPGVIDTPEKRNNRPNEWRVRQAGNSPLQRLGTPADIGTACVFFASGASSFITGTVMPVTGSNFIPFGQVEYFAAHQNQGN
ncbi:SDR family NAD(P)-dependent oxidoreductase [Paraburkholderia fynbosensis]|uniref:Dihydroanticapsin 7-dehydrogenase n=1 Tax=Paraburkholderia fynbosensis TaxID=1200993 RepID=A0A6J5GVH3_9BURK|nr:SDR family oxidoreductase [Paraburkholderia fynbosensis]CAB3806957.1 Dihydroanticapsin 7-dehydrogenase [Paraburkholderia fynbosensis]